jgi:phosphocarrier protein NPr
LGAQGVIIARCIWCSNWLNFGDHNARTCKRDIVNCKDKVMLCNRLTLKNRRGLHARASAKVHQLLLNFDARVTLRKGQQQADADSIMSIMTLAAAQGTTLDVQAEGPQAEAAMTALSALFERRFDEDE